MNASCFGRSRFPRTSIIFGTCVLVGGQLHAATLSVSPASIDNSYTGNITLQVGGLATGNSVLVEHYVDLDGNGSIGAGDLLVQSFIVTDGQSLSFGGVRDMNVPADEDGVAGQITTSFVFPLLQEMGRLSGTHLFRISNPTTHAQLDLKTFTVTQAAASQTVSGTVTSGGVAVPFAVVGLLVPSGNNQTFVSGVVANASGVYSVNVAPGTYAMITVKSGFVSGFGDTTISVGAGQNLTQDLTMTAAPWIVSGAITDGTTSTGVPGLQLFFQAKNSSLATIGFSGADGSFSVGVPADQIKLDLSDQGLAVLGYLRPGSKPQVDASTGNATLNVPLQKETALVYGSLKTDTAVALPGVGILASDSLQQNQGAGLTDANGNYTVGVTGGSNWNVQPDSQNPVLANYIVQGSTVNVGVNQALQLDFVAHHTTAHLIGQVVNGGGTPQSGLQILAVPQNGGAANSATTAADGGFDLGVSAGNWTLQLETQGAAQNNVVGPTLDFVVTDGVDITGIVYVLRSATATISGIVTNSLGQAVANVNVSATTTVNTTNYFSSMQTDATGHYQLVVFNGTWQVDLDCGGLSNLGYGCPSSQNSVINNGNATVNFLVPPPVQLGLYFRHFIYGGEFGSALTPAITYPVSIKSYVATLTAQNDVNFPPPSNVYFTGPAGSGLNGTVAVSSNSSSGQMNYFSPDVTSPAIAPGGSWTVIYNGNLTDFNLSDPQAASRVFTMVPTVSLSGGNLASVSWTFKDASGGVLAGPPAYVNKIQVIAFDRNLNQLEASSGMVSSTTGYSFTNVIPWSNVGRVRLGYFDTLGNRYYLNFNRATPTLGTISHPSANQFQFQMTGLASQTYQIDYSTTLSNWFQLYTTNSSSGVFEIIDNTANDPHRFYRVHTP